MKKQKGAQKAKSSRKELNITGVSSIMGIPVLNNGNFVGKLKNILYTTCAKEDYLLVRNAD